MRNCYFDCDNTLVLYRGHPDYKRCKKIKIRDQVTGELVKLAIHQRHVDWLKCMKRRGEKIIVWSAGGEAWVKAVCVALRIDRYVDHMLGKPDTIYDDDKQVFYAIPRWETP